MVLSGLDFWRGGTAMVLGEPLEAEAGAELGCPYPHFWPGAASTPAKRELYTCASTLGSRILASQWKPTFPGSLGCKRGSRGSRGITDTGCLLLSPLRGWGPPGRGWSGRNRGTGCSSQDTHRVLHFLWAISDKAQKVVWHIPVLINKHQPASHGKPVHSISEVKCSVFYLLHTVFKSWRAVLFFPQTSPTSEWEAVTLQCTFSFYLIT